MGRKALAGMKLAKKNGEPAVKFAAGARITPAGENGVGSGYLNNAVRKIKKNRQSRKQQIDAIMKDLD